MSFCPECLQNDITSPLTVMGIDTKIRICENNDCVYVENCSSYKNLSEEKFSLSIKQEPSVNPDDSVFCLSSSDSESDNLTLKKNCNFEFNDYQLISVRRHLQNLFDASIQTPGVFNWFCLPLMLKFNSKICLFLIIHLNLFNPHKHSIIQNIKELYCKTEDIVNNVPKKLITLLSFKFSQCLYKEHHVFNLSNMGVLDMSERILRSMGNFISSLDNGDMYKTIYSYSEQCNTCSHKLNYLKEDFSIRLMKAFSFEDNTFHYFLQCKKCLGQCKASVTILRLANFIIIDLPNGTSNNFPNLMSTSMSTITAEKIQLQAIIEFQCSVPIEDLPEKVPSINEFIFKKSIRQRIPYRIHFRNSDGWYSIDHKSGLIVKNIFGSDVNITLANVRILIYGHCNNIKEIKQTIPPCSLFKELQEYKKPPRGSVLYPHDEIKYWLHLFEYRDLYSNTSFAWRSKIVPLATKITANLNEYLARKKLRLKRKLKTRKVIDALVSCNDSDGSSVSNQDLNDTQTDENQTLEVVNFKDLGRELDRHEAECSNTCEIRKFDTKTEDKSSFTETSDDIFNNPDPSKEKLFPLHSYYQHRVTKAEHGIDNLIASKKMKMSKE